MMARQTNRRGASIASGAATDGDLDPAQGAPSPPELRAAGVRSGTGAFGRCLRGVLLRRAAVAIVALAIGPATSARAAPALDCPVGTAQRRTFYADEFWCARPDGTRHGPSRSGWAAPTEEGAYRDGKRDGWWRRWSNDVLVDEWHYDRDVADGRERTWSEKGVLLSDGVMSRGEKVGLWRAWHDNGRLASMGRYDRGRRVGRHRTWSRDGDLISDGSYRNDKQEGFWIDGDEYGEWAGRGYYARGEPEGRWTFTDEGQRVAVGRFRRGRREGAWTFYWSDGGSIKEHGRYRRGRRDGTWTFHDFFDQRRDAVSAACRRGEPHGRVVWRRAGAGPDVVRGYELVANFARGMLDGSWTERYPRGSLGYVVHRGVYGEGALVHGEPFEDNPLGLEPSDALELCADDDDLPGRAGDG
jgi:antitoxin component YwqK of YwqJK toxin-antitoxin module